MPGDQKKKAAALPELIHRVDLGSIAQPSIRKEDENEDDGDGPTSVAEMASVQDMHSDIYSRG